MKKYNQLLAVLVIALGFGAMVSSAPVSAVNVFNNCSGAAADSAVCKGKSDSATNMITTVINTLLMVLGIIAVIMIVVGGIRYTTSGGDSSGTKGAKDTIMYAIIGLVVAILAYTIVNFVLGQF
jgi:uncharacterized membrane protein